MSCREFQGNLIDLARGGLQDAAVADAAREHARDCSQCAALFAEQRRLTEALRVSAAERGKIEAPPMIEARLLEAFREQAHTARYRPNQHRWLAATAAAVFVATAGGATWWSMTRKAEVPRPERPVAVSLPVPHETPHITVAPARPIVRKRPARPARAMSPREEIVTEFFPLVDPESLRSLDGGQIMRVRLPRSALYSIGLPVNEDRAYERIQADVLVGNDGIARAVRFVR